MNPNRSLNVHPNGRVDGAPEIEVLQFAERLAQDAHTILVLDVREPEEIEAGSLPEAFCVPLGELVARTEELRSVGLQREIVVVCRSGVRSASAQKYLMEQGFQGVLNLRGGLKEYAAKVNHSLIVL